MSEISDIPTPDIPVPHPGSFIREELEARGWTQGDLAYVLDSSVPYVNKLLAGKIGITAKMAKALGHAFKVDPAYFTNLQTAYDLWNAHEPDPAVARRATLQSVFPVREMIKRGWFFDAAMELVEAQVARLFEAANVDEIKITPAHAALRRAYEEDLTGPQLAWLYRVRQIAREMVLPPYSEQALRGALTQFRRLMADPEEVRHVPRILTECGVRYVVVEGLGDTEKVDGVCTWLDRERPVIGMSIRRDRIDNFWFVLRHEIDHVLRKDGLEVDRLDIALDEGDQTSAVPEQERLANEAARDFCVPSDAMDSFIARVQPYFSERRLLGFAATLKVHPGIVAGQLRRRTGLHTHFHKFDAKIRQTVTGVATTDGWGQVVPVSA